MAPGVVVWFALTSFILMAVSSSFDFPSQVTTYDGSAWISMHGGGWCVTRNGINNMYIYRSFSGFSDSSISFLDRCSGNVCCQSSIFHVCESSSTMVRISDYSIVCDGEDMMLEDVHFGDDVQFDDGNKTTASTQGAKDDSSNGCTQVNIDEMEIDTRR